MPALAERSLKAPVSQIPDLGEAIRPTHISHLALATDNFDAMSAWWQAVLNAEASLNADGMRFMTFDDEHHKVAVFEVPDLKRRTGARQEFTGLHHIAFSYGSFSDLAETYLRLKSLGIEPWRAINHGTSFALDFHDPDFNICELQCSCFPAEAGEKPQLNEWLATGAFNRNPIGVLFDFEEAIESYRAGCPVEKIISPYIQRVGDHTREEAASGSMDPVRKDDTS